MIEIQIPGNNIPEREYIIKILLSDFLGLQYSLLRSDSVYDYSLLFEGSELIIKDSFFSIFQNDFSYLNADALPENLVYAKNEFIIEKDIPVIYGTDEIIITENKIICGIDIFASSFFMLTRWEEYVNKIRDEHNRFPGHESTAYKNNFLYRPLVNEYTEMLWNMIKKLGYTEERREKVFELTLTHDVDALTYVSSRTIIADVLKRKSLKIARDHFKFILRQDPFDTFDFLMSASEKVGVKSHFYFMSSDSKLIYDTGYYLYRRKFSSTIKEIKKRGHIIGFHPGYYTFDDYNRWCYEKQLLEEFVQQEIEEGRQHYLRMDVTKTLPIWDKNDMKIDSTLGFADKEGFRCGTGDIFPVFDFLKRKQLRLKERPLILMDGTLRQYQEYSNEKVLEIIQYYISIGKRYNSVITLLFHNSSFFGEWEGYNSIYNNLTNNPI